MDPPDRWRDVPRMPRSVARWSVDPQGVVRRQKGNFVCGIRKRDVSADLCPLWRHRVQLCRQSRRIAGPG